MQKRRRYFIDRNFQTKFILRFLLIAVLSSLLIGGFLLYLSKYSTTVTIENTKVAVKSTADYLLPITAEAILLGLIFSGIATLLLTLVISHKIAGPLYRLNKEINVLKDGLLRRNFKIRNADQMQELAKSLGEMCSSLRDHHLQLKEKYTALRNCLQNLHFPASNEDRQSLARILADLEEELDKFKDQ
jgi:methyl-accepting chemotaxis protein